MQTLGKKIRLLRHQKSWSQEDVAKQLGISIPAFSKIETGITDINLSRLEQISKLFEMTVVQLLNTHGAEDQENYNSQYAIKKNYNYLVENEFPKIISSDLASGIYNASYYIELSAIEPFIVNVESVIELVN